MNPLVAAIPDEKRDRYVVDIKRIGREFGRQLEPITPQYEVYLQIFEAEHAQAPILNANHLDSAPFDTPEGHEQVEQAREAFQAAFYQHHPEFIGLEDRMYAIQWTYWGEPIEALEERFIAEGGDEAQFAALCSAVLNGDFSAKKTLEKPLDFSPQGL